jgi:hypothetical protein
VTSPIYRSKVLGEFPDVSDDTLIQLKWIRRRRRGCCHVLVNRSLLQTSPASGEDATVTARREGGWVRTYRAHHEADTMTAELIQP